MTILSRILSILFSLGLLFLIFDLMRKRRLKEKYAVLWLFTVIIMMGIVIFEKMLTALVNILGIKIPINGIFFLGILFLIVINIHFSVVISKLTEQNKKIAQKLSLLELNKKRS